MGFHGWFAEADAGAQFQAAQKACQHLLPFGNAQGTETHQEFLEALKAAQCNAVARVPELARSESERRRRLGADGRRYEIDAVPGRSEDLRRARAPRRLTTSEPAVSGRPCER
jgi:hypothetical protein